MKTLEEYITELKKNDPSLTSLNLLDNNIGSKGAMALAEALKVNKTLTSLNLLYNNVGTKGAAAFEEALKTNQNLLIKK